MHKLPRINAMEIIRGNLAFLRIFFAFLRYAGVAELADAHDSKSCEVTPRVGSTPTSGTVSLKRKMVNAKVQRNTL